MHAYARKVAWVERTPSDMLQPNAWFMCQLSFTQLNEFSTSYTRTRAQLLRIPVALSSFFHRSFIFVLSSLTSVFQLPISPLCQDSRQFLSLSSSSSSSSFFFLPFWSLFNSFTFHGITCLLSCSIIRSICSFILFYLLFSYLLFSICPHWLSSICPSLLFPLSLSLSISVSVYSLPLALYSFGVFFLILFSFYYLSLSRLMFGHVPPFVYPFHLLFNSPNSRYPYLVLTLRPIPSNVNGMARSLARLG